MFSLSRAALLPLWAITCLQFLPLAAQAQAGTTAPGAAAAASTRPDPADATAPVPAVLHGSTLRSYQGFADAPIASWRDANALVQRRGGWRAYAREARQPDTTPPPAAAAGAAPADAQPAPPTKPAIQPAAGGGHAGHPLQ